LAQTLQGIVQVKSYRDDSPVGISFRAGVDYCCLLDKFWVKHNGNDISPALDVSKDYRSAEVEESSLYFLKRAQIFPKFKKYFPKFDFYVKPVNVKIELEI